MTTADTGAGAIATTSTPPAVATTPIQGRVKKRMTSRTASAVAVVIAVLWTIPTFGMVLSSLRPEDAIKTTGWWTFFTNPELTLQNYDEVLFSSGTTGRMASFFLNSLIIVIPATIIPIVICALAAYSFTAMNWKGRDWVFIGVFALQIVPLQMALIPLLRLFTQGVNLGFTQFKLPIAGTFWAVWIAHTIFALPLGIFLLHNFMGEVPKTLLEAAEMDGAGHARIFRSIILPLMVPALAAYGIFQFLWVWNDLLVALVFASPEQAPITARLGELAGSRGNEWQRLTAGAFVSIVVPLAVFFGLQRFFVRGLLAGSVKG
jgi:alpha-glucoside transport system permease protein